MVVEGDFREADCVPGDPGQPDPRQRHGPQLGAEPAQRLDGRLHRRQRLGFDVLQVAVRDAEAQAANGPLEQLGVARDGCLRGARIRRVEAGDRLEQQRQIARRRRHRPDVVERPAERDTSARAADAPVGRLRPHTPHSDAGRGPTRRCPFRSLPGRARPRARPRSRRSSLRRCARHLTDRELAACRRRTRIRGW